MHMIVTARRAVNINRKLMVRYVPQAIKVSSNFFIQTLLFFELLKTYSQQKPLNYSRGLTTAKIRALAQHGTSANIIQDWNI